MADYVSPMGIAYVCVKYYGSEEVQDNNFDSDFTDEDWKLTDGEKNLMMS
jgi:hypothetical protein